MTMDAPTGTVSVSHTSALPSGEGDEVRRILHDAFDDDVGELDWEHALGGMHALARVDREVVGHASVVQRRLLVQDRALRCGYVEAVAVAPRWQGRGLGGRLMAELEGIIATAYDLGALGSSDEGKTFYARRGWMAWWGPLSAITPTGVLRTPKEEGSIYVYPVGAPLDLDAGLACDWRDGDLW